MGTNELDSTFQTDALPEDITHDILNRRKFIETLATKISEFKDSNCLIIGIHGPWGSGKSTFIKFLESEIIEKCDDIVIVHFNPWNFSSLNQLVTMFFKELKFAIRKGRSARDITSMIGKKLEILGKILAPLEAIPLEAIPNIALLSPGLKRLPSALERAGSGIKQGAEQDPTDLKKELNQLLAEYGKKIIILIDDIDRLDKESMRLIFRLIRLNADFINTRYILSFDRKVVEKALDGEQGTSGREYLEKFIQVPFDLPLPNHKKIEEIISEKIENIFPPCAKKEFKSYRGENLCNKFYSFFKTLRDVKRYTNSLQLTLPQVNEEINYLDFASLEAIRIFCPDVYNELPNNKDILLGNIPFFSFDLNKEDIEKRKKRIEEIVNLEGNNSQQKILTSIISELFPHAGEAAYHGHNQNYRKDKRICSSIRFDKYFLLDVSTGEISQIEIDNALKIISNKDDFIRLLNKYKDKNILNQFLERMKDYINEISYENIKNIIEAFFEGGDELSIMDNGRINHKTEAQMGFLILDLIERIEDPITRGRILIDCIKNTTRIYIILYVVFHLNKEIDNKKTISKEELKTIKDLVVKRIREYVSDNNFRNKSNLNLILFYWKDFGNISEPTEFVSKLITNDQGVIKLLVEFITEIFNESGVHYSLRHHNLEELSMFVDLSTIYSKLMSIKQNKPHMICDGLEKIATDDFVRLYEQNKSNNKVL